MSSTQEVGEIFGRGSGPAHAMLRSPTVLIASVGLWGMNVFFFRLFGIDYVRVLKYDLLRLDGGGSSAHGGAGGGPSSSNMENGLELNSGSNSNNNNNINSGNHAMNHNSSGSGVAGNSNNSAGGSNSNSSVGVVKANPVLLRKEATHPDAKMSSSTAASSSSSLAANKTTAGHPGPSSETAVGSGTDDDHDHPSYYYGDDEDDDEYTIMDSFLLPSSSSSSGLDAAVTWGRLLGLSVSLLVILHSTYYIWIDILGGGSIGAVFAFYTAVTLAIIMPFHSTVWLRKALVIVLQRSYELINPRCSCGSSDPRPIPFVDVFFADAMCSLSKVFFDWGMLLHMASYYPKPVPKSAHNILIPSAFAAVPYLIRARQCLIMYSVTRIKNDPKRFSHLWNALKYSTSIFPLCLSAYQKTISPARAARWEALLIFLLVINALYALYWDIVMDWGLMTNPSAAATVVCGGYYPKDQPRPPSFWHALLRNRLRFGGAMTALILVADSVLRFGWVLRFYHKLFPSNDSFVLCTQFLEVFRRAIWNLLRIEWENIKQMKMHPPLPSSKNDEEKTSFLTVVPPTGKVATA